MLLPDIQSKSKKCGRGQCREKTVHTPLTNDKRLSVEKPKGEEKAENSCASNPRKNPKLASVSVEKHQSKNHEIVGSTQKRNGNT